MSRSVCHDHQVLAVSPAVNLSASIALWKNKRLLSASAYFLVFLAVLVGAVQAAPASGPAKPQSHLVAGYGQMPLYFEANQGQTDSAVQFLTRSHGYSLLITQGEVVLTLRQPDLFAKLLD